jgi:hypothetical protein
MTLRNFANDTSSNPQVFEGLEPQIIFQTLELK